MNSYKRLVYLAYSVCAVCAAGIVDSRFYLRKQLQLGFLQGR